MGGLLLFFFQIKKPQRITIGITDHDTFAGWDAALEQGKKENVSVVCGVEVSIRFRIPEFVGTLHYLLYVPHDIAISAQFREDAENIFKFFSLHFEFHVNLEIIRLARGPALVRARVEEINKHFGPNGVSEKILNTPLQPIEIEVFYQCPTFVMKHNSHLLPI